MDKALKRVATVLGIAAVCLLLWYFRGILVYIALAAVVTLVGRPLVGLLMRIRIGKVNCPAWLASIVTIIVMLVILVGLATLVYPVLSPVVERIGDLAAGDEAGRITPAMGCLNEFIIRYFPSVGEDFSIGSALVKYFAGSLHIGDIISSLVGFLSSFALGIFSVIFISFFLLSNTGMLTNVIAAIAPQRYETQIHRASDSIARLLSRYFLGIIGESIAITIVNSLGFILILRMETGLAIMLAMVTGILNVIPYVGPFVGHILALTLSTFVTYYSTTLGVTLPVYLLITFAITMTTQLVDNYLLQPLIYASSVKAHPLEIFLVILMAAKVGGIVGLLAAVPAYTVLRVIAAEFLSRFRFFETISKGLEAEEQDTAIKRLWHGIQSRFAKVHVPSGSEDPTKE